jgi:hypothetical protein
MAMNDGAFHTDSISAATGLAVKKVEEQLMASIAACEDDVRRGVEDLARLKDALRSLRRQTPASHPFRQAPQAGKQSRGSTPRKAPTRPYKEREGSAASIIRSFVRRELEEAGHPLTRSEIFARMNDAGIKIDAKAPIKRIAKVMWSSPEFVNVGDGYWIAGMPIPDLQGETSS